MLDGKVEALYKREPRFLCLRCSEMANSSSAEKRVRQIERRAERNRDRRGRIRTAVKEVELAIEKGSRAEAEIAFKAAEPELMRGVTKRILKKNTASRKVSRLSARVNALK